MSSTRFFKPRDEIMNVRPARPLTSSAASALRERPRAREIQSTKGTIAPIYKDERGGLPGA